MAPTYKRTTTARHQSNANRTKKWQLKLELKLKLKLRAEACYFAIPLTLALRKQLARVTSARAE